MDERLRAPSPYHAPSSSLPVLGLHQYVLMGLHFKSVGIIWVVRDFWFTLFVFVEQPAWPKLLSYVSWLSFPLLSCLSGPLNSLQWHPAVNLLVSFVKPLLNLKTKLCWLTSVSINILWFKDVDNTICMEFIIIWAYSPLLWCGCVS